MSGQDEPNVECETYSIEETGKIFGMGRNAAYEAAKAGEFKILNFGGPKNQRVPKAWVRQQLAGGNDR